MRRAGGAQLRPRPPLTRPLRWRAPPLRPGVGDAWNTSSLDSGGECGAVYAHRFPMPPPASRAAPYYSFDAGPVHFVMLSTEHSLAADSQQLAWLRADMEALAAAGDARLPWTVVSAHRFFYVDSSTVRARDA